MARKPSEPAAAGNPSPESVVAHALRVSATSQRAAADMLDALATVYENTAASPAVPEPTGPAGATPQRAAASGGAGIPSLDAVKDALMKLVDQDAGKRTRVDPIIIRHAGALMSVKDIPADRLAGVLADAQAEIAKGNPATSHVPEL